MIIKVITHTGFAGCVHEDEFEMDDDATDEQIEECAKDVAFQYIDWYWQKDEEE